MLVDVLLIFLLVWLFGFAPFHLMVSGLHGFMLKKNSVKQMLTAIEARPRAHDTYKHCPRYCRAFCLHPVSFENFGRFQ